MASRMSCSACLLWIIVVMFFTVHHSEEVETDCSETVIINSIPQMENDRTNTTNFSCADNCSDIFKNICIYNFYRHENSLISSPDTACNSSDGKTFIHNVIMKENKKTYYIIMNKSILHSITLRIVENFRWMPHCVSDSPRGTEQSNKARPCSCNETGDSFKPAPVTPSQICDDTSEYNETICKDNNATAGMYILMVSDGINPTCMSCTNPMEEPETKVDLSQMDMTNPVGEDGTINPAEASAMMDNMKSVLDQLGDFNSASLSFGELKGVIQRVNRSKGFAFAYSGKQMGILSNPNSSRVHLRWSVDIPVEAVDQSQAANNRSGFAAIMRFPNMAAGVKDSTVLDAVYAIEMAANISNLTDRINIHFQNTKKGGMLVQCSSWGGDGKQPNWTQDGCITEESNSTITCKCSHLTFFAILMSLPPTNGTISESDLNSLTYISYIGCGLSLFFLGVALFMHYLLRKAKSSQAIQILMNLFVALFLLNLAFLTNEWVANTGSYAGCVIMATVMHYSMLATFTWFAMQALHLYLHLVRMADTKTYKHYMLKMCIPAWVCPAVTVIIIASLGKYEEITIITDTGYKAKMCWTRDTIVHYVVNIGYYAIVFLFSLGIFFVMVQRILAARKMKVKDTKSPSTSKNLTIIMSLLVLLGITWGVAFFSYGPMVIPSYYIFCILNSFQGLFLFIYYYHNSRDLPENLTTLKSSISSSTTVSHVYDNTTNG